MCYIYYFVSFGGYVLRRKEKENRVIIQKEQGKFQKYARRYAAYCCTT